MRQRWTTRLAWLFFGLVCLVAVVSLISQLALRDPAQPIVQTVSDASWILFPIGFGLVAALIISYQPENLTGWLLVLTTAAFTLGNPIEVYLGTYSAAPVNPSPWFLILIWFNNWSWLLLIFPLLLIILLFPTGQLPSPRWRWVLRSGLVIFFFTLAMISFSPEFSLGDGSWTVANPVGFLSEGAVANAVLVFGITFMGFILCCAASIFVRFRRAAAVEREQIKWLLYACGLFVVVYLPIVSLNLTTDVWQDSALFSILFTVAILAFPAAIAIAILRYHLWDIDVIIRKTLVYGVLTALLALVFGGLIIVLQQLFGIMTDSENSPPAIVLSTLAIAALFNPLRKRLQDFIDRRFYRRKYDAEQILAEFAYQALNEADLGALTIKLEQVVTATIQPENFSLELLPIKGTKQYPAG